jgi:hypothetical protein
LTDYGWIVISAMYLSLYLQRQNKYLTIENGFIKRIVHLEENKSNYKTNQKFCWRLHHKTEKTKLTINTQIIDPNSLTELKTIG